MQNHPAPPITPLSVAIVGAGPVGLTLALLLTEMLPQAQITTYDARQENKNLSEDPRVLALSLGSIQLLTRVLAWPSSQAQPIQTVYVSQQQPSLLCKHVVTIEASEQDVPMLGAVIAYGTVLAALQERWVARVEKNKHRLKACFDSPVNAICTQPGGRVAVDAGIMQSYDLVVVAEGGIFSEQTRKTLTSDYQQKAWIGRVTSSARLNGQAFEHFTSNGPVALLPITEHEAALVWCQQTGRDEVESMTSSQRLAVLNTLFPQLNKSLMKISELQAYALGLNAQKTLVKGREIFIGNAAQTLHPVAGQGLNLGLRDAYVLAEQLAQARDIDRALKHLQRHRQADRYSIMGTTEILARGFLGDNLLGADLRNLALGAVEHLPGLKHYLARHMMFGWR